MKPVIDGVLDEESQRAIRDEFDGADLGDRRREARLATVVRSLAVCPSGSLPNSMGEDAALEGLYRLLSNEAVKPEAVLAPHIDRAMQRARDAGVALAIHDTTENEFSGEIRRKGLGPLRTENKQGFLAHVSLLAAADGTRLPFGVAAVTGWARTKPKKKKGQKKMSGTECATLDGKESKRWLEHVERIEEHADGCRFIHITDREGDIFVLLLALREKNHSFVIRMRNDRVAREGESDTIEHMKDIEVRSEPVASADVRVSPRPAKSAPNMRIQHPAREGRVATVTFSAARVRIRRPQYVKQGPAWLELNAVFVTEPSPPEGSDPINWTLLTSEPIDSAEQIAAVVNHYRARWLIEEYFKALKTGCAFEKRQLESFHALINLFAIFVPIAVQMLRLRAIARIAPDSPASEVLTPTQIEVLRACVRKPLPPEPRAREVLIAIAGLGGFVGRNKEPGWLVIARGFEKLALVLVGWLARDAAGRPNEDVRNR